MRVKRSFLTPSKAKQQNGGYNTTAKKKEGAEVIKKT